MGVTEINNIKEFYDALETTTADAGDSKKPLMVVDCYATWCPPCKAIAPVFEKYSEQYSQAAFYKVNVDEVEAVAMELGIASMPTFVFFQDGQKIETISGARPQAIEDAIKKNLD